MKKKRKKHRSKPTSGQVREKRIPADDTTDLHDETRVIHSDVPNPHDG